MGYQTYIFDLYGTLIDIHTDEEDLKVWETLAFHFRYSGMETSGQHLKTLVAKEIEVQMEEAAQHCEFPDFVMQDVLKVVGQALGGNPDTEWLDETVRWFRILSMRHLALYDGVREMLVKLKEQGKGVFLLSNGQKTYVEAELRTLGIYELFDGIAISSEAGISKPDPLFYKYLEDKYHADLSSAIMVGNDPRTDMEGAQRMGIDGCYIHSNSSPEGFAVNSRYQIWDGDFYKIPI
ncbi:putative hydrolase of the HAD superfamily [Fontibacillus solani]|uniref:Putative hydrolase of the HAD superfamily n=1 Tax=Fontibacillus solani TaxID=1572857 RepID=A0A7W3XQQ8_9BACL|nr:HAD family hydrolase [Fontibacillus solani]MBA9084680.1 putative hydrolase of the HAD superfamily [Fontibacillus solani]